MRSRIFKIIGKASMVIPLLLIFSAPAHADTFRCAGHIIERGMDQAKLLEHCGEPDARSTEFHNTWTYKGAAGHRDIVVYFYANGHIEQIRTEDP